MPHSSGGGSHGGGTHGGGSHGGSSGNHVSHHYFPGARRYRRHRHGHPDDYIYARSKPQKINLFVVILLILIEAFIGYGTFNSVSGNVPHKLKAEYLTPDTHIEDAADVIGDDGKLEEALEEFEEVTGICPVIYTVYDEEWAEEYADLETYTYCMYVDNYPDEQHFVIVYSLPLDQRDEFVNGGLDVPDFAWEAVQGDETDPILTEGTFRHFSKELHEALEEGADPGDALTAAFEDLTESADESLNLRSPLSVIGLIMKCMPMLIVLAFFGIVTFIVIRQFVSDRNTEYEEAPMDLAEEESARSDAAAAGVDPESISRLKDKVLPIIVIVLLILLIPFILSGIGMLVVGIAMLGSGLEEGIFFILFSLLWTGVTGAFIAVPVSMLVKRRKKDSQHKDTADEIERSERYSVGRFDDDDEGFDHRMDDE